MLKKLKRRAYIVSLHQAKFREEKWELSFEEFCEIWSDEIWSQRGKEMKSLVMTRIDPQDTWQWGNIQIITRHDLCKITGVQTKIKNRRNEK